ncbi:MAG: hypothetical protein QG637_403, partial [Chloroflexota bacterium]|nr:hypothetical protein [Chloroflexota bacterium]
DIWDHGQGWRVAESEPVVGSAADIAAHRAFRHRVIAKEFEGRMARAMARDGRSGGPRARAFDAPTIPAARMINGGVRSISNDDTAGDQLFNREIQDHLLQTLEGRKLDLIGFDACLMGMVETGYAMRDIARVMVGSEELEPGDGWNYADWLRRLVEFPNMDTATLGETIVASYRRAYQDRDSTVTLSAVDLGQMPKLAGLIDDLAGELLLALPAELANILLARGACAVYAPGYGLHGIDLARLCEQLSAATTDAAIQAKARAVQAAVAASVIANYAGEDRQDDYGSHGLAIYFPESRALFQTDPDGLGYLKTNTTYPLEFVQSFRWADFLQAYYALVP